MTDYNGSQTCSGCGGQIDPVTAMLTGDSCTACRRARHERHVKNRMVG